MALWSHVHVVVIIVQDPPPLGDPQPSIVRGVSQGRIPAGGGRSPGWGVTIGVDQPARRESWPGGILRCHVIT